MIEVCINDEALSVTGHAGYAKEGQDIVCASVSALCCELLQGIMEIAEEKPDYKIESGEMFLDLRHLSIISEVLVDAFFIGVREIARAYPEYVCVRNDDKL